VVVREYSTFHPVRRNCVILVSRRDVCLLASSVKAAPKDLEIGPPYQQSALLKKFYSHLDMSIVLLPFAEKKLNSSKTRPRHGLPFDNPTSTFGI
jgi:hypothetical protein